MNAKEMFEKLGYERKVKQYCVEYCQDGEYIKVTCEYRGWKRIVFDLDTKKFYADEDYESMYIDVETFKAIQQQLKELGWL